MCITAILKSFTYISTVPVRGIIFQAVVVISFLENLFYFTLHSRHRANQVVWG